MPNDNEPYLSAAATESSLEVEVDISLNNEEIADEVEQLGKELIEAAENIRNL